MISCGIIFLILKLYFYIYQGGWKESPTELPRNTSNLCAVSRGTDIYLIGADISGTYDTKTDEWVDLPNLQVSGAHCS